MAPSAFLALATSLALCQLSSAASSTDWASRSIYQVLTDRFARSDGSTSATCNTADRVYCGGSWQGIIDQLDYIQGMGFDAIWISPITKQLEGSTPDGYSYHGYWQQDLYTLNSHFGSTSDLQNLAAALHSRSMYLMVDVVTNHMGWNGAESGVDYSTFNPFNSQSQYHSYCTIDFDDYDSDITNIQQCWEGDSNVPLPDLRTEDSDVASGFQSWISQLVSTFDIDGLRVDSVLEVNTDFWSGFASAAGVYMVGEVYQGDAPFVCNYQNYMEGILNYPTYFALIAAFESTSGSISGLVNEINTVRADCKNTAILGTFSENHDQPRFASLTGDIALAKNVITFTILADGIPILYEGQEQHYSATGGNNDPYNREAIWFSNYDTSATLYQLTATLNAIRKNAIRDDSTYLSYQNWPIYSDTTTIAMRKGKVVTVLSNKGTNGASYTQSIPAGYASGTQVTELLTCSTLTADGSGNIVVPMANGLPRIYYPSANIGSLCGGSTRRAKRSMRDALRADIPSDE